MRQATIEMTAVKLNNVDTFIAKIHDPELKSYFEKPHLVPAECHFDKIKAQKNQIIEDALMIYRTNSAYASNSSKRDTYKLVEEVAGLVKVDAQSPGYGSYGTQVGGFKRQFPKTLLSPNAYAVLKDVT